MILIWRSEEIIRVISDDFLEEGPETISFISHCYYEKINCKVLNIRHVMWQTSLPKRLTSTLYI